MAKWEAGTIKMKVSNSGSLEGVGSEGLGGSLEYPQHPP